MARRSSIESDSVLGDIVNMLALRPVYRGGVMREPDLADQLRREHYEGMAADRLERERRRFDWDIEGWDGDELKFYIAGSGLHRIPLDDVERIGRSFLAEAHIHREGDTT